MPISLTRARAAGLAALAAALIAGASATSTAQDVAGAPPATQTFTILHVVAAREAIAAAGFATSMDNIIPGMMASYIAQYTAFRPDAADAIRAVVTQAGAELQPTRADLDRQVQRIWASYLTEPELRELTAFFQTPIGLRYASVFSQLFAGMDNAVRDWAGQQDELLYSAVSARLAAMGIVLAAPAPTP